MGIIERWTWAVNLPIVRNHDIRMHSLAHFSALPPEEKHSAAREHGNRNDGEDGKKE